VSTPARPKLSVLERELLIERAAIIEFDGNKPRTEAERLAWRDHEHRKTQELLRGILAPLHAPRTGLTKDFFR
jgi:hypothetical protein